MMDEAQMRRWDLETRVLVDMFLERGAVREVTPGEAAWVVMDSERWCAPYVYDYEPIAVFNWYETLTDSGVLTLRDLESAFLKMRHPNCPLLACEDFNFIQKKVPRALLPGEAQWFRLVVPGEPSQQVQDWQVEDVLAPHVEPFRMLPPRYIDWSADMMVPDYRRVVRIAGIDMGEPPKAEHTPKPDPSPKSKVPRFIRERQPRLDGR